MRIAIALLIPVLLLPGLVSVAHAGLYRWVDAEGNVHYSDSIPPEQVDSGHTELSDGGVRIESVSRAKTPEELQKEKELERLRTEQERLLEEQRAADRVLLKTFRSEDDIDMARNGKIATIDTMIDITKGSIRRQQESLARLRTRAANLERTGKPIPQTLRKNIAQTEGAIRDAYADIIDREKQKSAIHADFERDLVRFRQLRNLPAAGFRVETAQTRPLLHNIVTCSGPGECNRLWGKATAYVRQHATTPVQTSTDAIFITAPPATEQDVSLILSRIDDKKGKGASLFLDVQCQRSALGEETCQGRGVQAIMKGFRAAIVGENAPAPRARDKEQSRASAATSQGE